MTSSQLKQQLRQEQRQHRRSLLTQQRDAYALQALEVFKQLITAEMFPMATYLAFDGELDPKPIIEFCWKSGYAVYLPVVVTGQKHLKFAPYTPETLLLANQYGILQPQVENSVGVDKLQSLLMPLTAYDKTGARLGMGGGYYDTTIANCTQKPRLIGLAYAFQEVSFCPMESHDETLDAIITNDGFTTFK